MYARMPDPVGPGLAPVGGTQGPFTFTYPATKKVNANSLGTQFSITAAGNLTAVDVTGEPAGCNGADRKVEISGGKLYLWYTGASKNCIAPGNTITLKVNTSAGTATQGAYNWDVLDANAANADQDGDGLLDGIEVAYGTDPTVADTDADGYNDLEEMVGPSYLLTNPTDDDTDGDTVPDRNFRLDTYDTDTDPPDGIQDSGSPDGIPDFPDWNGDNAVDTRPHPGMSDNVDSTTPPGRQQHQKRGLCDHQHPENG
jgi:hypothetical protein